jgi:hypothetical protein
MLCFLSRVISNEHLPYQLRFLLGLELLHPLLELRLGHVHHLRYGEAVGAETGDVVGCGHAMG